MTGFIVLLVVGVVAIATVLVWRSRLAGANRSAGAPEDRRPASSSSVRAHRGSARTRDLSPTYTDTPAIEEATDSADPGAAPSPEPSPSEVTGRRPLTWDDVDPSLRDQIEQKVSKLSTLPTMMTQLIGLLQDVNSNPREIARTAATDPAVVAEVLRTVNSSFYGLRSKVTDVGRAVLMLGYSRVKLLVLQLGVRTSMPQDEEYKNRLGAIWRHCFLASEAVAHLSQSHCASSDREASTAALLHDLGKLLLLDLPPRTDLDVGIVFRAGTATTEERIFLEEDYFGVNHCLIGARIADKLSLSDVVKAVQSLHHHPLDDPQIVALEAPLIRCIAVVKLGNVLANAYVRRVSGASEERGDSIDPGPDLTPFRSVFPGLPTWEQLVRECEQPLQEAWSFLAGFLPPERIVPGEPPPETEARPGTDDPQSIAGRYTLLEKLGEGGVGAVYLCEDALLGQRFAIKIMRPGAEHAAPVQEVFVNEVRVALKLAHPNIVRVFHFDQRDGVSFILQEYLEGRTLDRLINEAASCRIGEDTVVSVAAQLADALAYAHEMGVVHRDLNPNNVMVDEAGRIKLCDFGVAACKTLNRDGSADSWGYVAGTPSYMSPEHWLGIDRVDPRSDIYSLGVMLYRMLSGKLPFTGDSLEELREAQRSVGAAPLPFVSDALNRIVLRCLEPDPGARWADCRVLTQELRSIGRPVGEAMGS